MTTLMAPLRAAHTALMGAKLAEERAFGVPEHARKYARPRFSAPLGEGVDPAKMFFERGVHLVDTTSGCTITRSNAMGGIVVKRVPHGLHERELRSFNLLRTVLHDVPGVMRVSRHVNPPYCFDPSGDTPMHYFVYEFAGGQPLGMFPRGTFSERDAAGIAAGVCRTVAACHMRRIYHGDFKLGIDNVLIGSNRKPLPVPGKPPPLPSTRGGSAEAVDSKERAAPVPTIVSWGSVTHDEGDREAAGADAVPDYTGLCLVLSHLNVGVEATEVATGELMGIALRLEKRAAILAKRERDQAMAMATARAKAVAEGFGDDEYATTTAMVHAGPHASA